MNIEQIGLDCVGCGSCEQLCPHKAITLQPSHEGFLYPVIDKNNCIDCSACFLHCPQNKDSKELVEKRIQPISYNAISRLNRFYRRSSSGAAFATFAYLFLNRYDNAIVCGASFYNGLVQHIIIDKVSEIRLLQGSKYVQSQIGNCYIKIREHLKKGGYVLFSGTPCQVAGLKTFLGKLYTERLLLIDIICHGVPSPKFLTKDLLLYEKDVTKIKDLTFRRKHPIFKNRSQFCLQVKSKTLLNYCKVSTANLPYDPYFSMFSKGLTLRHSCYQCHYTNLKRVGDITIGDCDSHSLYPNFHPYESTSVIIINTEKGFDEWAKMENKFDYIDLDLEKEADVNIQLRQCFHRPPERDTIYEELNSLPITEIKIKYARPIGLRAKIGKVLFMLLPERLYNKLT